ncbi:translation initiation factor IF-2 [Christensenellaceae bacterium OttesenSCG-928-M15]|nr:translation initiation factor IF-2 [Christensenellaceae bacterium OttesenSCG-928-M15]
MAKPNVLDTVKNLEARTKSIFERVSQYHASVGDTLQDVRSSERSLKEKEERERQERLERERQERLMQMLNSEQDLAVHIGGNADDDDYYISPVVQDMPKEATPQETKAMDEEPPSKKVESASEPEKERASSGEAAVKKEAEAPTVNKPDQAVEIKPAEEEPQKEKPVEEKTAEPTPAQQAQTRAEPPKQGGYQQRQIDPSVYQRGSQQGNYQQRPQQGGGYQQRPQQQGGYQQRPQQGGYQQGGYQQRPQQGGYQQRPQQGGYQQRPQQGGYQQGGYQQRPQQGGYQQGGYQQRPQQGGYQQGGYQQRPQQGGYQQGGYQQRPQQGGYQQRPQQGGGYQQRPQTGGGTGMQRKPAGAPIAASGSKERVSNYDPNKSNYTRNYEAEKRARNKRAMQKDAPLPVTRNWDDDTPMGSSRRRPRKQQQQHRPEPVIIEKAVITTEKVTVKELSEKIGKPAGEIIKKLFMLGVIATINQDLDFDTVELIASDYGIAVEQNIAKTFEEVLNDSSDEGDTPELLLERSPVVTIMGHVDHGKTSLLDAIRHSKVTVGEAGGITQHIGAYTVDCNGRSITFIDTPGHEAFTSMRARGAQVTDIVILVVAADDGIKPQTVEAINHAKAAEVPIIVAVNKMDKPEADPERVKQQLTEHALVSEEWGGDTIIVPVSAKSKMGLDNLLEMVLLQADVMELKANPNRLAKGTIVEAQLDKGRGPVATVLVQNGTLHVGDPIVAGTAYGRVRAMMDDKGRRVKEAGPSQPVEVLGFSEVPSAGDTMNVAEIDKLSRQVAEERRDKQKAEQLKNLSKVSLDDLFSQIADGEIKDLNIIVKADVQGSVEAVKQALEKLSNEEVRVRCIHGGVGAITGSDIMFASASNAIVIGFNVRMDTTARQASEKEKVDVRMYSIIYNAIEDVESAMKGMFKPIFKEVELGRISVRETFRVSGVGTIAGGYVQEGKVNRNAQVRVVRGGIVIHEGKIASLKRFKDDVKEVATGYECGIGIENFNDLLVGDSIEAFEMEEIKR